MESNAGTVVIGAGIVGCSTAYHLAELGETDVLVLEQGPLFATGGSSSHAPGLVFQTNPAQLLSQLAAYTVERFTNDETDGRPCFHQVGGIEVATTPERWDDLKRKLGLAKAWHIEADLIGPAEVHGLIPEIDPARILGGLYTPTDGIAKPVRAAEAMARAAQARGVRFLADTRVTGFDISDGLVRAVRTTRGSVEVERVLCCAGIWGPAIGALAGVSVPAQPLAHQYAVTTPLPGLTGTAVADAEVTRPILRHQDSAMYFRQIHDRYGIGSYQHRAIPVRAEEIAVPTAGSGTEAPSEGGAWKGMPSVHPFTAEDFAGPWQDAIRLLPELGHTQISEGMNGLFLFTSDGMPLLASTDISNEAGLGFAVKPGKGDFIGRDALLRRRERPVRRRLRCLTVDDGTVLLGSEPVHAADEPDRGVVGFTTSTGYGHSVGASLAYAWLPAELAAEGTRLEVSYFDQRHSVTVVADPSLDPEMTRMRC